MLAISKYAYALFDAAKEAKELKKVYEDYSDFVDALKDQRIWVYYATISSHKKTFKKIDEFKFKSKTFPSFLKVVIFDGVAYYLKDIQRDFFEIANKDLNIGYVVVEVPKKLPPKDKKNLEKSLKSFFSEKKVIINYTINKDILSGLKVSYMGKEMDRTIDKRLQNMFFEMGD